MLFKAKSLMTEDELNDTIITHDHQWVTGNLIVDGNLAVITGGIIEMNDEYLSHEWWTVVDRHTVGQDTGLTDKNETPIFEKDWVRYVFTDLHGKSTVYDVPVTYDDRMACIAGGWLLSGICQDCEIIPGVHDLDTYTAWKNQQPEEPNT